MGKTKGGAHRAHKTKQQYQGFIRSQITSGMWNTGYGKFEETSYDNLRSRALCCPSPAGKGGKVRSQTIGMRNIMKFPKCDVSDCCAVPAAGQKLCTRHTKQDGMGVKLSLGDGLALVTGNRLPQIEVDSHVESVIKAARTGPEETEVEE